jgi:hypothetical protein
MSENKEKDTVVQEEKKEVKVITPPEVELEKYRYGDLIITCKCGHDTILKHPQFYNVEVGLNLPTLTTDNKQFLGLSCEKCKSALTLRMVTAKRPPAYDFSVVGFGAKTSNELTWKTGENPTSFNINLGEIVTIESEDGEPKKGKEVEFKSVGVVTEPKFTLELEEGKDYRFRVDTTYDQEVFPSDITFISTKEAPVEEKTDTPTAQVEIKKVD